MLDQDFKNNRFAEVKLTPSQDPWETAKAYHKAAQALLPDKHIRVGVGNGKITCRATPYGSHGWEQAFRERSTASN